MESNEALTAGSAVKVPRTTPLIGDASNPHDQRIEVPSRWPRDHLELERYRSRTSPATL